MSSQRVFLDTNIILEAFRVGCWSAICHQYKIETVEKCIEEALTGDPEEPGRTEVKPDQLTGGLAGRHAVSKAELAQFALKYPDLPVLDDGELHLLAWLDARGLIGNVKILLSTSDKAAIVAASQLGGLDSLVSLEKLSSTSGVSRSQTASLRTQFGAQWLEGIKTKVILGVMP